MLANSSPANPTRNFFLYVSALLFDPPADRAARAPGQALLLPVPGSPACCGRAERTDRCRVFCERSSGLALTLSHLSELCKIFLYGLLPL